MTAGIEAGLALLHVLPGSTQQLPAVRLVLSRMPEICGLSNSNTSRSRNTARSVRLGVSKRTRKAIDRVSAGLVPDLGGPRIYPMADLLRGYLRAAHRWRLIVPLRQPGRAARAFRAGANLAPDCAVGRRTWEEFLAQRVGT